MAVFGKRQGSKVRSGSAWLLAPNSCNSESSDYFHDWINMYCDGDTRRSSRMGTAIRDAISSRKK